MKQKRILIFILAIILLSGCVNVFEPFDEPAEDDVSSNKFVAQEAIREGNYTEARENATKVLEITYAGARDENGEFLYGLLPEDVTSEEKVEFVEYNSIIAETYLQEKEVDTLSILNTMSSVGSGDGTMFTDIDVSLSQIEDAKNVYDKAVPTPEELNDTEKTQLKSNYQTAGVVYGIYTATKIEEVFDLEGDDTVKVSETTWSENAGDVIDSFEKSIDYLSISMPEQDEGLMSMVVSIKDNLSKIGEEDTIADVKNIIKGVE